MELQRQFLKKVVDDDSWVHGRFNFEPADDFNIMIAKLCTEFERSLPLFKRRQHFFDMKRGKSEPLYMYMLCLQMQAMAAKLDSITSGWPIDSQVDVR